MSFLRRKSKDEAPPPPPPSPVQEDVSAQQYTLKLNYLAKSSDGLRMQPDPAVRAMLPGIVEPLANSPVETIEPLSMEYSDAAPTMERFTEMQQWVLARREIGPIGRHALYVLESTDALDMTVDTFFSALLHGETDTSGYPDYAAIVAWPATGMSCRGADRARRGGLGRQGPAVTPTASASGCSARCTSRSSHRATAWERPSRPVCPDWRHSGLVCAHCGFEAGSAGAFYCPKCGMRMSRS